MKADSPVPAAAFRFSPSLSQSSRSATRCERFFTMEVRLHWGLLLFAILAATGAEPAVAPDHAEKMAKGLDLFTHHVRPLLLESCFKCHGGDKTRAGLDLASRETLLKGGENGPVVGDHSTTSKLYRLAAHMDAPHMPPKSPRLKDEQLRRIASWIDLGAPYDKPLAEKAAVKKPMVVTDEDRRFWAFRPLARPTPPEVKDGARVRTPGDGFILAKLEEKGLSP